MKQSQEQSISEAYDIIAAIWQKQDRVMSFADCYGDGTRFPGLKRDGVFLVWHTMFMMVKNETFMG